MKNIPIDFNSNELWKILDAITAYQKDYAVSGVVEKTLNNIKAKLKNALNDK